MRCVDSKDFKYKVTKISEILRDGSSRPSRGFDGDSRTDSSNTSHAQAFVPTVPGPGPVAKDLQ